MPNGYPQTEGERLVALETRMCNLEKAIREVKDDVDGMRLELAESRKEQREMLKHVIDSADERYASKLSERLIFGMAGATLLAVLYLVLNIVGI